LHLLIIIALSGMGMANSSAQVDPSFRLFPIVVHVRRAVVTPSRSKITA
jgi:hypothetical protein